MNFDAKEIFSIRKFKTGTHSARLGKVALASAAVLAVGLGTTAVSADETTTTVTPEVAVVTTANPATNLETAQSAPSQANLDAQTQSGTNTGAIVTPVETPEVNQAVSDAKEAGVTVTETSPVTYDTLAEAQADANKQVAAVENAEAEKVANTEAIAEAEATNKQIDAENEAEEKRVAEVNKAGQAAVDQRNQLNEQAVKDRNNKALATWEENKKAIIATDEKAMQGYEARKAANEAANKAGQEAVDAENAKLQAEYEKLLAEYKAVLEANKIIDEKNAAAQKVADEKNAQLQAEYQKKLAEMQKLLNTDGYATEVIIKSLVFENEPQAEVNLSGKFSYSTEKWGGSPESSGESINDKVKRMVTSTTNTVVSGYSDWVHSDTISSKPVVLNPAENVKAVYTNLQNSYYGDVKIDTVEYTYTNKSNSPQLVFVAKDPTNGVIIYNYGKDSSDLGVDIQFKDESGNYIEFSKGAPAYIALSSLNSQVNGDGSVSRDNGEHVSQEAIKDYNFEFVPINGSTITENGDGIYSKVNNDYKSQGSDYNNAEWDQADNPLFYYGSAIAKKLSGNTISFTSTNLATTNVDWAHGQWLAISSKVASPSLPTPPKPIKVTPEKLQPTPSVPVEPKEVTFVPTPFTEKPPVPSELPNRPELENFTPEDYVPVTPVYKPHVDVPNVKDITVSVHPLFVKQSPANVKAVVNADGENTNGTLVPKGSTQTWILTNSALKAGRQVVTSYVMNDPLPSGFVLDREATASKNTAWMMVYDESGKVGLQATEATLAMLNANRDQDVAVPVAYLAGTPINDGGTYKNTFESVITTPSGEYKVVSNTPVIYTPGNDPKTPRKTPKGDNPTPNDNLIQPEKDVIDVAGKSIDGKSVLPNTVLNYVAKQDFDQYKGMSASQSSIAKGFMYADDYLDAAIDGKSLVVNSITAANGDDVTKLLTRYHVLSQDSLSETLQELVKTSGISPVGEFYLWVAKDPQAFYEAYVQKGLDITYNLSFKIKESFTEGDITNQTFQVDFGNGYYGNVVKNTLPLISIHKDVLDEDGKSIDGGLVKLGDKVTYKLEGWVVPAGRGYDINSYVFVDMLQHTHDEFKDVAFKAKIDFTLSDGTEIKSGDDLSKYVETVYNAETGRLESRFKADFLAQITRDVAFGADGFVSAVRIKDGEVVNSYDLIINDYGVLSNKVTTTTPKPVKPADPQTPPTPSVPASVLPSTGEASSLLSILGGGILSGLGFVGIRKRKEN